MKITVKIDADRLQRTLGAYARQLPFAASLALNNTAYGARVAATGELKKSFDRPTPWIQRSILYEKTDKRTLRAAVYIDETEQFISGGQPYSRAAVLRPHIVGGMRITKLSERSLRLAGHMGAHQYLVPGPGAPVNSYGNITAGKMQNILGWIGALPGSGYSRTRKTNGHYVVKNIGVFRRTGNGGSVAVLFFTSRPPIYGRRFYYYASVLSYVQRNWSRLFNEAILRALRTAR